LLSCEEIDKKTFVQLVARFLIHFLPLKRQWPFAVGAILIGSSTLYGQAPTSESWNVGTGSWFTGTNWLPTGPPTNTVNAFVENGGTAQIAGPGAEAATLSIGGIESPGGTVQLLSGGDLTVSRVMIGLGGTLEFSGGGNTGGNLHANTIVDDGNILFDGKLDHSVPTPVSGSGTLTMAGTGTLIISSTNTYSGGTNLNSGTIAITNDANLGTGPLNFNGGTLEALSGIVSSKPITLNTGGGTFLADAGTSSTLSGIISGPDAWTKTGSGTLILSGTNTYGGGTNLNGGILAVSSDTNLGTGPLSFDGGTLEALSGIVSSKPITLNIGGGTFLADAGTSSTLSGDISGKGGFVKLGDGVLTLSGTNSYTGATTVSAGVLQAGSTGAFSAGSEFIVNAGATLNLNGVSSTIASLSGSGVVTSNTFEVSSIARLSVGADNTSTIFSGTLQDGSPISILGLTKVGIGTLTLTGESTYTGQTTIDSGSLIINGSIASTQTVVNLGGFLGGTGLIEGNLVNNGTVSPGNPVGTLTVGGNYTQSASGTLRISVGGLTPGQFSLLAINGHATVGGNLQLISLNNFKLQVGNKVTFLTANGGVSGTFSSVQNPFVSNTIVKAQVILLPGAVEIAGTQGSFTDLPGLTPNESAVAKALDSAAGDPRAAALFAFLNSQPLANLPHDLSLIAPTQISSMNATTVSLGKIQASNIGQRLLNIRAGSTGFSSSGFGITGGMAFDEGFAGPNGSEGKAAPPAFVPTPENRWGVFVTGTGEFTNVDSTSNAAGYNVDTGGITVGVDYRLTPNFVIGLDASYAHSNISLDGGGDVDVNAGTVGLYATAFANNFYLDAAASGGPNGYDTHRTALQGSASGSTDGANVNVLVAGGYDWKRGDFSIGPTAAFQFSYVSINGFTETGSLAPLKFRDQSYESERTIFGAKASYQWKIGKVTLIPQVSAGWVHEYGSVAYAVVANFANGAGNSFTVNGPEIGRDGVLVDAGMSMLWSDRISTYIYYDGELARTNYDSHTVTGGIRISF
jgi:autotransporter-associated beta strand protein